MSFRLFLTVRNDKLVGIPKFSVAAIRAAIFETKVTLLGPLVKILVDITTDSA